jgi:hypothetical protein
METVIDQALLTQIRAHAGCPVPPEAIEIVWKESEKVSKQRGTPIEFVLAEQVKALWSEANQRQFNAAGKPVDFEAFCKAKLAKTDSLFSKLLGRKSKVQQAQADVAQVESEINSARAGLAAASQKAAELTNDIATSEADLSNHDEPAVQASIEEAARILHLRHRSPHNSSVVDAAVSHAVQAEVMLRILNARLIYSRDLLAKEEAKVEAFKQELKRLEKQL